MKGVRRRVARERAKRRRVTCSLVAVTLAWGSLPSPSAAQAPALDTTSLASGRYASMRTLLEKTIFRVDVLTLDLRFDHETAQRVESLARGRRHSQALADSIADVALHSQDAFAQIEFQRDVSLRQFVDGIRENMRRAQKTGIISRQAYDAISEGLPRWFAFLEKRRIQKGDRVLYRIRGDTLRTIFQAGDGALLLDQTDVGPERRLAVLGSYFAPKSDFRDGLVKSLFENEGS